MSSITAAPVDAPRFRQGAGRLCLDFIRTLWHRGAPDADEELVNPAALAAWVRQFGAVPMDPVSQTAVDHTADAWLGEARAVREAIHTLITAARGGDGPASCDAAARELINRVAARPVPSPSLDTAGRLSWQADDMISATLALIARDAIDLVASPALARVRECADPDCPALFLDSSRPGTRRWCSMDACGNRAKKNTLRAKGSQ